MKTIISILGLMNGGYMLLDGIFVMVTGKFIGPDKPGPWANLFYKFNINVFKLGPLFVLYGLVWFVFLVSLWTNQTWAYPIGLIIAILTLWYIPIGTLFSLMFIILLLVYRQKSGL